MKILLVVVLAFFIGGCAPQPKSIVVPKSVTVTLKTLHFSYNDSGFWEKGKLKLYQTGQPLLDYGNHLACLKEQCMDKPTFVSHLFGNNFPFEHLEAMLHQEIFEGIPLKIIENETCQESETFSYCITKEGIRYRNTQFGIIFEIEEIQ